MRRVALLAAFAILFLFVQLSYSAGERYTSIIVSKEINESSGNISLNISVFYYNVTRITVSPEDPSQPVDIVEQINTVYIEKATVFVSFYNTTYNERGELTQTLTSIPSCYPVLTDQTYEEEDKVVYYGMCFIDGELYSKYFNNTCRGLHFYFPGVVLPHESIPPTETVLQVCTGKPSIFNALKGILASAIDPNNPFCISMFIIFGLLLATLFFTGRSPLPLLDMVTPMLPKPRRFSYTGGVHSISHKKAKEGADRIMKELDKETKAKEKKVGIPDALKKDYKKAEGWRKMLVIEALSVGNVPLAQSLLKLSQKEAFEKAGMHFGPDSDVLKKASIYINLSTVLGEYSKIEKVPKFLKKPLKLMGKFWVTMEISAMIQNLFTFGGFVKKAVKMPFVRAGELKRLKAVAEAKTPQEKAAALAELEEYRDEKGITPVNRIIDVLGFGNDNYKALKEKVSEEIIAYALLRALDRFNVKRQKMDEAYNRLIAAISKIDQASVNQALTDLEKLIQKIDALSPAHLNIIAEIRRVYAMTGPDPYLKANAILSILQRYNIITGRELSDLRAYVAELTAIDRMNVSDIQKFILAGVYIKNYRGDILSQGRKGNVFVPLLLMSDTEIKPGSLLSNNIFSMMFARELLFQKDASISDVARFFFGLKAANMLHPLMEVLPKDFAILLERNGLTGIYSSLSSFSSRMFDELAKRSGLDADKIKDLMAKNRITNKFELLNKDVFKPLGLNTQSGDWHIFSPHYNVPKTERITASALGRAVELSTMGRVKELFENAFNMEAFMLSYSNYYKMTRNFASDYAYNLGCFAYFSTRKYVADKLGIADPRNLTDAEYINFMKDKKNLDLYFTDFEGLKGKWYGTPWVKTQYGCIPLIQDIFAPQKGSLDRYFTDSKISDYIEKRLGYVSITSNLPKIDELYRRLVAKGGIATGDSFVNMAILVKVGNNFQVWKPHHLTDSDIYKIETELLKKGQIASRGDFAKLYAQAISGDYSAFSQIKRIAFENNRMDIFMNVANQYQMTAKDSDRYKIFTDEYIGGRRFVFSDYVKYVSFAEARETAKTLTDKIRWYKDYIMGGAMKPIMYAAHSDWEAMGRIVMASEVARRLAVEYAAQEQASINKSLVKAIKDYEHTWEWTYTRDALLYGGFERYARAGYLTTGFHVGPAMPVTNWMSKEGFSTLLQGIPLLSDAAKMLAISTYKVSVAFSRPFVLAARGITFERFKYPTAYDVRTDLPELNPFMSTQVYYPLYSAGFLGNFVDIGKSVGRHFLYGVASFVSPFLAPWGFYEEMRRRPDLPLRSRVREAIKNCITRAQEFPLLRPTQVAQMGVANLHVYVGAPRLGDMFGFRDPLVANIGDRDTNPGLSFIESYTGRYVWEPIVPQVLERKGLPLIPRLRDELFSVHEKRSASALGMAAFYYSEIYYADPFNFKDNPLYVIISPGTAMFYAGRGLALRAEKLLRKIRAPKAPPTPSPPSAGVTAPGGPTPQQPQPPAPSPPGPVSYNVATTPNWNMLGLGGPTLQKAIGQMATGRFQRWLFNTMGGRWYVCHMCGTRYYGLQWQCPRCSRS